ncbi:hypothetical protein [Romboutsia ilealis]|uniref:hypothetical protein n=1 Tax=Romboutsia ilealis TaxID=1115758 RepID=UPI0025709F4D|nr:hypothetical protein [Romboutsia ilealis]
MECHNCKYYECSQYENTCNLLGEQYFTPYYGDKKCEVVNCDGEIDKEKYEEWFEYK